jgi:hypothetical protein
VFDTALDRQRVRRQCKGIARALARRLGSRGSVGTK